METHDSSQTPHLMQLLLRREAELCAILRPAGDRPDQQVDSRLGEVHDFKDLATEEMLATVERVKVEHATEELKQVRSAWERMQTNSYGLCVGCGEAIDPARLSARPATPCCVACQAIHEAAPRQPQTH